MLTELIDKYYKDKREERNQEHFYISDAGKCQRAIYFSIKRYPRKEREARVLRIFDRGDVTHRGLLNALFGIPEIRIIASEVDIPPKELFRGHTDAIISIDNKLYVVEIKSSSEYKFKKLNEPEETHLKQLQLYMHYFKIPQGVLIYENKNTQELKEFEVKYSPELCKKILSEFRTLKEQYMDQDIIPPIPLEFKKKRETAGGNEENFPWECRYCDFEEECDKVERKSP